MPTNAPLHCGHWAPDPPENFSGTPGQIASTGVAFTPEGKAVCVPCAHEMERQAILGLGVGENYAAYAKLNAPHGREQFMPIDCEGLLTTWDGHVLGTFVPGTLRVQRGHGFNNQPTTRYHFRAVVSGEWAPPGFAPEHVDVLLYGTTAGDGMLARLKRMIDRPNPQGDAPRASYPSDEIDYHRRRRQAPATDDGFDLADTEEI